MDETVRRYRGLPVSMLALASALALAGCVNPAFREGVAQFGTVAKEASDQQNSQLAVIAANEQERIRSGLAQDRAILRLSPACAAALAPVEGAATPECSLVLQGNRPIEQAPKFEHILALSAAIGDYADGLALLTADSSADQATFATNLSGLATSLGKLDGAVQEATGATAQDRSAKFGAVASLLAEAGNLYFEYKRNRALKRIVVAADPLVQEAVALLSGVGAGVDLYDRSVLARQMAAAEDQAQAAAADPAQSVAQVRAAQDALFAAVDAFNSYGADQRRFKDLGIAHSKLAAAARSGASAAELKAALQAVIALAGTTEATINTLRDKKGSAGNGNQGQ